jgi:hypothetical protein
MPGKLTQKGAKLTGGAPLFVGGAICDTRGTYIASRIREYLLTIVSYEYELLQVE